MLYKVVLVFVWLVYFKCLSANNNSKSTPETIIIKFTYFHCSIAKFLLSLGDKELILITNGTRKFEDNAKVYLCFHIN